MHNLLYDLISLFAVELNDGVHPKHHILQYKEWFLNHIEADFVVLDIGSNTGAMPALIARKAQFVYGIEIDPKLTAIAKETYEMPNLEFLLGDATSYCYRSCRPINCVTLSNVLEHIDNRVNFLRQLQQELPWSKQKPRLFLIRVPTIERDWLSVYKKDLGLEYRLDRTHKVEHTRRLLAKELVAAGLKIVSIETRFGEYYVKCSG